MKCPYCQEEMQRGTILGYRQPVEWHSQKDLHEMFWDSWSRNVPRLSESDAQGNTMTEAFRCAECKIVIIQEKT